MKVFVLGEDKRSMNLRKIYSSSSVRFEDADIIFCPIPFSKDNIKINSENIKIDDLINTLKNKVLVSGVINDEIREKFEENNIKYYDIMQFEEFSIMNAVATSEGAIKKAIEMTDKTLNGSNILILGYGRIERF